MGNIDSEWDALMELKDSIKAILEEMKAEYATSLPGKISLLTPLWALIRKNQATKEQVETFFKTIHHLSGTAGTLGFPEISETSKEFENKFLAVDLGCGGSVGPSYLADLDQSFRSLTETLNQAISSTSEPVASGEKHEDTP